MPYLVDVKAEKNDTLHNENYFGVLIQFVNEDDVGVFPPWLQKFYEADHKFSVGGVLPSVENLTPRTAIVFSIFVLFSAEAYELRMCMIIKFKELGEVGQKFLIKELTIHLILGLVWKLIDYLLVLWLSKRMISIILPAVVKIPLYLLLDILIYWHAIVELLEEPKEF